MCLFYGTGYTVHEDPVWRPAKAYVIDIDLSSSQSKVSFFKMGMRQSDDDEAPEVLAGDVAKQQSLDQKKFEIQARKRTKSRSVYAIWYRFCLNQPLTRCHHN